MFLSLLAIGFFFRIGNDEARLALVSTFAIGFFTFFYGIGAGPVPFTFSAEVFPLAFRGECWLFLPFVRQLSPLQDLYLDSSRQWDFY